MATKERSEKLDKKAQFFKTLLNISLMLGIFIAGFTIDLFVSESKSSVNLIRSDISKIIDNQARLREALPKEYISNREYTFDLDSFKNRLDSFDVEINNSFCIFETKIDKKFLTLDTKIDNKFLNINKKLDSINIRIEDRVDELNKNIQRLMAEYDFKKKESYSVE